MGCVTCHQNFHRNLEVSIHFNRIFNGFSRINHPFKSTPNLGNPHLPLATQKISNHCGVFSSPTASSCNSLTVAWCGRHGAATITSQDLAQWGCNTKSDEVWVNHYELFIATSKKVDGTIIIPSLSYYVLSISKILVALLSLSIMVAVHLFGAGHPRRDMLVSCHLKSTGHSVSFHQSLESQLTARSLYCKRKYKRHRKKSQGKNVPQVCSKNN